MYYQYGLNTEFGGPNAMRQYTNDSDLDDGDLKGKFHSSTGFAGLEKESIL